MVEQARRLQKYIQTLMNKNIHTIFFAIVFILLVFLILRKPQQIYPITKQKTIETRIKGAEKKVEIYNTTIGSEKKIIASLDNKVKELMNELELVKNSRDTFKIVQTQDTIIHVLYTENTHLKNTVSYQDTVITAQRYIINSKDTIIATKEFDLKRVKRQRNISLIANGVLTGLLILK